MKNGRKKGALRCEAARTSRRSTALLTTSSAHADSHLGGREACFDVRDKFETSIHTALGGGRRRRRTIGIVGLTRRPQISQSPVLLLLLLLVTTLLLLLLLPLLVRSLITPGRLCTITPPPPLP